MTMPSNPNKVVVQLGANVAGLLAGMTEAMNAVRASTGQMSNQIRQLGQATTASSQQMMAAMKQSAFTVGDLVTSIVSLGTIWKTYSIGKQFVELGIATNAGIEQAKLGIASLITAQATLKNAAGETLTGAQALE